MREFMPRLPVLIGSEQRIYYYQIKMKVKKKRKRNLHFWKKKFPNKIILHNLRILKKPATTDVSAGSFLKKRIYIYIDVMSFDKLYILCQVVIYYTLCCILQLEHWFQILKLNFESILNYINVNKNVVPTHVWRKETMWKIDENTEISIFEYKTVYNYRKIKK